MNRREAIQRTALVLGYAVSAPALLGVLKGCKAQPELAFKPIFFNPDQAKVIEALSGIIIPKTKTPGAIEVGVPGFIDKLIKEVYSPADQEKFLAELKAFDDDASRAMGDGFAECKAEDQVKHYKKHHDEALGNLKEKPAMGWWNPRSADNVPFALKIKELVLLGFFTSQVGASDVLQYNQVPGPYKGCVPLADVGKTWAT